MGALALRFWNLVGRRRRGGADEAGAKQRKRASEREMDLDGELRWDGREGKGWGPGGPEVGRAAAAYGLLPPSLPATACLPACCRAGGRAGDTLFDGQRA